MKGTAAEIRCAGWRVVPECSLVANQQTIKPYSGSALRQCVQSPGMCCGRLRGRVRRREFGGDDAQVTTGNFEYACHSVHSSQASLPHVQIDRHASALLIKHLDRQPQLVQRPPCGRKHPMEHRMMRLAVQSGCLDHAGKGAALSEHSADHQGFETVPRGSRQDTRHPRLHQHKRTDKEQESFLSPCVLLS